MRALLCLALCGCSVILQERMTGGIDSYDSRDRPNCDDHHLFVALDGIAGVATIGGIAYGFATTDAELGSGAIGAAFGLIVLDGIIHGVSALIGNQWVGECRQAKALWREGA